MSQDATAEVMAQGKYLRLMRRENWEYVERVNARGVVAVVGINSESQLIVVEQYRPALRRTVIEIPAGLVGDIVGEENESLIDAAKREFLEETGYAAGALELLDEWPTSSGLAAETVSIYYATHLRKTGPGGGDDTEQLLVHEVSLPLLDSWLSKQRDKGYLIDPKLYAALYVLRARKMIER